MTTQDRDRLKVLHEVKKKHITQKEAAKQSDTPREAGGLMSWAASKAVGLRV
jgi:hypothetical protein